MEPRLRKRIAITGLVQGVGFRPFTWKLAHECGLTGWVRNHSAGVLVEIQGGRTAVQNFADSLRNHAPSLARIETLRVEDIETCDETNFVILDSAAEIGTSTAVSADIATCDDCLQELFNPTNRRYRYPFINCTHCGPRFTILEDLPYDRSLTTMKSFPMCDECLREYDEPSHRRFHAQPNACHRCGPKVWLVSQSASAAEFLAPTHAATAIGEAALSAFQAAIAAGTIVAVKGIGGFHLVCDATNCEAIARLRQRKGRTDKPFAIMVRDLPAGETFATITAAERRLLTSSARPIVLLKKRASTGLSEFVAPQCPLIGVMLPYSPLHHLLLREGRPLVMTSGNRSDEPIARDNVEARDRLSALADSFLLHDRDINVVCDDSVVRCVDNELLPIRRSRGYAPLPLRLIASGPSILAVGGEFKSTFCATKDDHAVISAHIGDMGNLETLDAMSRSVEHFLRLFRIEPQSIVADLHPGYLSTQWAKAYAEAGNLVFLQVQHHHAHIASLMTEHELPLETPMIGCCFDGTGYGLDGAIWGGEFFITGHRNTALLAATGHGAPPTFMERFAHLKYTPLPGGDASIRRPYRVALAQLYSAELEWRDDLPCLVACQPHEARLLRRQLEQNFNCVSTSSVGRLFDAVASMIGVRQYVSFEAQAAMELEALASELDNSLDGTRTGHRCNYRFQLGQSPPLQIDASDLIGQICDDLRTGVPLPRISLGFHHAVADMIVDVCRAARSTHAVELVGLSGGVFQNILLLKLTNDKLARSGFQVLMHRQVPPNDAGLALGQALLARAHLRLT